MAPFGRPSPEDDARAEAFRAWLAKRHPLAIASLVLGVVSLMELGTFLAPGIAGVILGVMAIVQLRRQTDDGRALDRTQGHRLAWTGIALSTFSLVIALVLYSHRRSL